MSDKKSSKSKSKQKQGKPPKDAKSKKSKDKEDAKSKKSVDKADKGDKASKKSKKSQLDKSKVSIKPPQGLNQSQSQISFFKPMIPSTIITDQSICQYHKEKNTIFCQICEQVGCQSCLVYGPHNNQMHRVGKIDEQFKARYLYLNEIVCGDLIEKRDLLNKKLQQLMILSDQLRYYKGNIEKITKMQYNQVMERLKISSGSKFAILHHEMAELQKDLQAINNLGNQFFQLTNMNPESNQLPQTNPNKGMVPFLLRTKFLQQQAQELISKPIKTTVQVFPYDLPRQLTERKMIIDKNKGYLDLLSVKDECVWQLVQQKKIQQQKLWSQFYEEANTQVQQWSALKNKIQNQLQSFRMHCSKCHTWLDQDTVNSQCSEGQYHYFCK